MKQLLTLTILLGMITALSANAQPDTVGWGRNSRYNRMYNPNSVTDIEGKITKVDLIAPMKGMSSGVHLTVASKTLTYSVHVGPKWYLDQQSFTLNQNDHLKITGSKVSMDGADVIIARQIVKGKTTLTLRDKNGIPNWSMGRRGKASR